MSVQITTTYRGEGSGTAPTIADLEDFLSALPLALVKAETAVQLGAAVDPANLDTGWYLEVVQVS